MKPPSPEILAPAGSFSCLNAAINAGADAIYFGISGLNMRAGADNFNLEDLPEIMRLAKQNGIRAYLALNTLVYQNELQLVDQILVEAARLSVDAVIAWDPAVIARCTELHIPLHISTQASISNASAAKFYKSMGAERIVPARECSLEDLITIAREADIEVEAFVHGAMCLSVSGRCLLSWSVHGASGNRGACRQNCRREYRVVSEDGTDEFRLGNNYILSAKDLCTIPFIEKLLDAGIDSFKIEGRNRPPEYVATVVKAYRQAVSAWENDCLTEELKSRLIADLHTVFNRDFSSGFYLGKPVNELAESSGSRATLHKQHVGRVLNYYKKARVAEILVLNYEFSLGDQLLICGSTTGAVSLEVSSIRVEEKPEKHAPRGIVTVPVSERVRENDQVFRLAPRDLSQET